MEGFQGQIRYQWEASPNALSQKKGGGEGGRKKESGVKR